MTTSSANPEESPAKRPGSESADELESLSVQFGEHLAIGQQPDLDAWLKQVPQEKRQALLDRLNSVVMKFQSGLLSPARPSEGEQEAAAAPGELSHSRVDSIAEDMATRDTDTEHRTGAFTGRSKQLGNYTLEQELGRGGMGVVYRARHCGRGEVVALKVLPDVDGARLHRFKREFRSLADLSHPNLIGLRTLESDGDNWFFTMELVERARSFRSFVRPDNVLNLSRLRSCLIQLVQGVQALHQHGVIHRDLKPSNVLVDPSGRVVILDFGLVSELERRHQTITAQELSGTPAYMAPETVAREEETYACDWYAVGTMLYEALSGQLPFEGDTLQMLSDKRSREAPPLSETLSIPDDLRHLCLELLKREPGQRPGYAQIMAALGGPNTNHEAPAEDRDMLLGREWHLATLKAQYQRVHEFGKPITVFVSGKSGEGKSALVDRFLRDLTECEDVTLLAGRCYDRESVPFKALDSLIDALAGYLRQLPPTKAALLLPDDTRLLVQVFPVLARVDVVAELSDLPAVDLDERQIRKRAFSALRKLLARISQRTRLVLFCDDLQWGDADSAEAMHDVLDGLETPKLLFIGCYRQDEAEQSSFLRSWNQYQAQYADTSRSVKLEVGSLTVEHCIELIRQRAYSQDDNLCRRLGKELFEETGGNAFILHELLECIDQEKLSLRRIPLRQVIAQKLSALPPQASSVLIAVAVSGKAMTAPMVGEVTETGEAVYTLLTTMRNARLIRFIGEDDDLRIDTYHDKIRESVLESLDQNVLRAMHRRLMEVIENAKTTSNAYIYDLAYHADACGDPAKARKYSLLAARLAREQLAPQVAVQQYEISLRHSITDLCNPGNYELAEGYASSLLLVGRYHDAQEILKNAQGCSETTLQRVRLEELSGLASFKLGNLHASLSHFHQALSLLEEPTPKWLVGKLLSIAKVYATNQLRSLRRWQSGPPPSEIARASTRILTQMAKSAAFSDGLMMVWCALRGISIAERYQPTSDLAFCYIIYASAAAAVGQHRISLNYAKKGLELYSELNDEWGEGHSLTWSGINAFARGDYLKAIDSLELGVKILERVGDEWDINIGMFHLACSLYQLGRLDTAIETAYEVFERSVRYGDTRTNCALYLLAKASDGRADLTSYLKRRLDAPEDILATCNFHKCLGIKLIAEEKFPEAVHETNIACDLPLRHRLPNYHSVAGVPLAVAARRRHAESLELGSKVRRAALTKARSLASRALWICSLYPPEYPAALREYAEVSRIAGKTNRAIKYFDKSIRNAEQQSASYEAAKARLGKAQLLVQLKEPGAEKFLTAANEEMSSFCELIAKGLASINNPTNSSTR